MTTKKLIKELMALGVSRNAARKVPRIAREHGMSNAGVWNACFDVLMAMFVAFEAELGISAAEADDGKL